MTSVSHLARTLLALALALPLAAAAQPAGKAHKVGVLSDWASPRYEAFRQGLRDLGYVEGRNLVVEARFSKGDAEALPGLADELVRLRPDVILATSSTYVRPVKLATRSIPIVFAVHNDPIGTGDVASLARPGGNITGLTQVASELSAKQLQLLREIVPKLSRVAIVWNPATPSHAPALKQIDAAAATLGLSVVKLEASSAKELDHAFAAASRERVGAVLIVLSPFISHNAEQLAATAAKHRLPTLCPFVPFVEAGGLVTYGPDLTDLYRRSASYVDKILKGAKPADLPVEQPTKFELVVNRKTAATLGLSIPREVLLRADRVIQ